ncbi:MAG: cupredoxin domain-containing protein [Patescibacteria group bacterium]|nr:cupredoxin domain-containing protein [Patescibacteria group bacterium]
MSKNKKTSNGTNKTPFIVATIVILAVVGFVFILGSSGGGSSAGSVANIQIKDGIQYVTIAAGGGYSPKVSTAKAGIPTKLIVKTNGSYDCSSSLAIHSIGFQKILPQTGETEIDIGTPVAGVPLRGVCGMGMYSFLINFN